MCRASWWAKVSNTYNPFDQATAYVVQHDAEGEELLLPVPGAEGAHGFSADAAHIGREMKSLHQTPWPLPTASWSSARHGCRHRRSRSRRRRPKRCWRHVRLGTEATVRRHLLPADFDLGATRVAQARPR